MADTDTGRNTPIGGNAVQNIEDLRAARGLSLRHLAERLRDLGHPMQTSAVHSLTQGKRRIDVDDLVALALALGVNPNSILFPRRAGRDDEVQLTPEVYQLSYIIWGWADGIFPLPDKVPPPGALAVSTPGDKMIDWVMHARPDHSVPEPHPAVEELITLRRMLETVLADPDSPETYANWRDVIIRRFRLVSIQLEELLAEYDRKALVAAGIELDAAAALAQIRDAGKAVRLPQADYADGTEDRYREAIQVEHGRTADSLRTVKRQAATPSVDPLNPFGNRGEA